MRIKIILEGSRNARNNKVLDLLNYFESTFGVTTQTLPDQTWQERRVSKLGDDFLHVSKALMILPNGLSCLDGFAVTDE